MSIRSSSERKAGFRPSPHEKKDVARFLGCLTKGITATFVVPHIQVQRQQEMRDHLYRQYANTLHADTEPPGPSLQDFVTEEAEANTVMVEDNLRNILSYADFGDAEEVDCNLSAFEIRDGNGRYWEVQAFELPIFIDRLSKGPFKSSAWVIQFARLHTPEIMSSGA